jgi:hypothetical protein
MKIIKTETFTLSIHAEAFVCGEVVEEDNREETASVPTIETRTRARGLWKMRF